MKKLFFLIIFIAVSLLADVEAKKKEIGIDLKKYDRLFEDISKKRAGLSDKNISKIKSPFIGGNVLKIIQNSNKAKSKRIVFKLYGIVNQSAKINKKWYRLNSKIYGYRLIKINNNSVVLKSKKKILKLFLRNKDDKIKIF